MDESNNLSLLLIDSNIFLRVFVRDHEEKWQDCMKVIRAITEKRLQAYIPLLVVIEVQFVLDSFYRFEKNRIVEAIESMKAIKNLQFTDDISLENATDLFKTHNVKFTDCLLASSKRIQEGNAAIVSYDRDFDKLKIPRLEPRQLLSRFKN